jgi:hypothetical protein
VFEGVGQGHSFSGVFRQQSTDKVDTFIVSWKSDNREEGTYRAQMRQVDEEGQYRLPV